MEQNNLKLKQVSQETEAWKKILGFLQQENGLQKNKLAEMLGNHHGKNEDLLEIAEQYQHQFLQQDQAFRLMWYDIAELEKLIEETKSDNGGPSEISQGQKKLGEEIKTLEINFDKLKSGFNNFLDANSEQE
jgi:Zn-finger nucleic acid-binding protein